MKLKQAIKKSLNSYKTALPIIVAVLLLVALINEFFQGGYSSLFGHSSLIDTFIGAIAGSISFGIPLTSYIVGGELLDSGVSLAAITAFILSWTTVGVVMLPLEAKFLGWRFAAIRNGINFVFAVLIAYLTVFLINLL